MARRIFTECLTMIFSKAGVRDFANAGHCAREACRGVIEPGDRVWRVRHNRSDGWQASLDMHPECGAQMEFRSGRMVRPATDIVPLDERRGQRV
jgi:hypothetical protein